MGAGDGVVIGDGVCDDGVDIAVNTDGRIYR